MKCPVCGTELELMHHYDGQRHKWWIPEHADPESRPELIFLGNGYIRSAMKMCEGSGRDVR